MNEKELEEILNDLFYEAAEKSYFEAAKILEKLEIESVNTFEEIDLLTYNKGVIIRLKDSSFLLTIQKYAGGF